MKWTRRVATFGLASSIVVVLSSVADAQILDRVFGGGGQVRTRVDDQSIERNYQGERIDDYRDREGRTYRSGTEIRSSTQPYAGDTVYRSGERIQTRTASNVRRGTTLIGSTVRLENGHTLGRVDDIVLSEDGYVEFIVVSVSGLRGMSGRLAVLPFAVGQADFGRRTVYVDWSEEDLRRAPIFFSSSRWPDFTDTTWTEDVFAYFEISDSQHGRAYRGERERSRFDEQSGGRDSRDRDFDRESDDRSGRARDDYDRSSRTRDSYDREQGRTRSDSRSRDRDMSQEDDQSDRSSRDRRSTRDSDRDSSSEQSQSDDSDKDNQDSDSSSNQNQRSRNRQNSEPE
jgi:hypothetical protein